MDRKNKKVRVWVDGCFDLCHFGHANAMRQAKTFGDYLIAGIHSDAEITKNKGPPVFNEDERYKLVAAVKWVDEIVKEVPYVTQVDMLDKYSCDFCVHGDDITTDADGVDTYRHVKRLGRYKECKRTQGVSTTDLVGRMLLMTKSHHGPVDVVDSLKAFSSKLNRDGQKYSLAESNTQFFTTSSEVVHKQLKNDSSSYLSEKIIHFANSRTPKSSDKVVYLPGAWDMFHTGHVDILEKASKLGTFVLVGIHVDQAVNRYKGINYPIMNLNERVLGVLACRYVDEVIIGAPYSVTSELLDHFKIAVVVHGSTPIIPDVYGEDPYKEPKIRGIFKVIDSGNKITTQDIVDRIISHRQKYESRNKKKQEKEMKILTATMNGLSNGPLK